MKLLTLEIPKRVEISSGNETKQSQQSSIDVGANSGYQSSQDESSQTSSDSDSDGSLITESEKAELKDSLMKEIHSHIQM